MIGWIQKKRNKGIDNHLYRTRPGERVAKRRRCKSTIGVNHKSKHSSHFDTRIPRNANISLVNSTETMKWFKNRFDGIIR